MEKNGMLEQFFDNWNVEFPDYPLSAPDLKKPHTVLGALFKVFDRLGIDRDAVLSPPPEENHNEHIKYYWDLLPVINTTRVVRYHISMIPVNITHFLQPMATTSHPILMVLLNLLIFNETKLREVQVKEEELFLQIDEVKQLEDKKNRLLEMLNEQACEKEHRAKRVMKLDNEMKQFEEELKLEKEAHDAEQQELQAILKENKQIDIALEQKKGQRDALIAEIEKKQAMRVYDANDIRAQAEQAAQNVQDAEEKLKSFEETLMQKKNSLKNLQTIKPNLDAANNLLHEIMKISDSLRELESGDLEADSKEGELDVLGVERGELAAALAELRAARQEAGEARARQLARRQHDRALLLSNLRDAEEKDKKCQERCKKAIQRTQEIKELTTKYEAEKAAGLEELTGIQRNFTDEIKTMDETLLKIVGDAQKQIEDRLKNRGV